MRLRRLRPFQRILVLAILLALVSGCGTPGPTASPAPTQTPAPAVSTPTPSAPLDPAAVYSAIESRVEQIRQLQPKAADVAPTLLDDAGVRAIVDQQFAKSNPPAVLDANERLLKALGLLPADASLQKLETDLLASQVAGMYDPDTKKLYVVSKAGSIGPVEKVTFAHEFTHELQDQNFGLKGLGVDQIGQGDRDLGRLALVEGDATTVMSEWEQQNLTSAELTQLAAASFDPKALAILASMPPVLRETLLFPYTAGLTFVLGLRSRGGWQAVDAAFRNPPDSTEQILHPAKYLAHEKPIDVSMPTDLPSILGTGWRSDLQDTLGELQLRIWLQAAVPAVTATEAAAGWGGDRIELLTGPDAAWAVVLRTAWDTPADAQEFEAAARLEVAKLPAATLVPSSAATGPMVLVASDAETLTTLEKALLGAA